MKKRFGAFCLVMAMACSLVVPAGATNVATEEYVKDSAETIVISSVQELQELSAKDEAEYNGYLEAIDPGLKEDFEVFCEKYPEYTSKSAEEVMSVFLDENPEYEECDLEELQEDIGLLAANPVVTTVRNFFSVNGFDLSLALFNHSLTSNPAAAELTLVGNTGGMYSHIKTELRNESDFFNSLVNFSRASETPYRDPDWGYNFDSMTTDLYWSIHRCDVVRNRTAYNTVHFRIVDEYDFEPSTIPGVVAGACNTNPFHVEIYGVIQNGAWK